MIADKRYLRRQSQHEESGPVALEKFIKHSIDIGTLSMMNIAADIVEEFKQKNKKYNLLMEDFVEMKGNVAVAQPAGAKARSPGRTADGLAGLPASSGRPVQNQASHSAGKPHRPRGRQPDSDSARKPKGEFDQRVAGDLLDRHESGDQSNRAARPGHRHLRHRRQDGSLRAQAAGGQQTHPHHRRCRLPRDAAVQSHQQRPLGSHLQTLLHHPRLSQVRQRRLRLAHPQRRKEEVSLEPAHPSPQSQRLADGRSAAAQAEQTLRTRHWHQQPDQHSRHPRLRREPAEAWQCVHLRLGGEQEPHQSGYRLRRAAAERAERSRPCDLQDLLPKRSSGSHRTSSSRISCGKKTSKKPSSWPPAESSTARPRCWTTSSGSAPAGS